MYAMYKIEIGAKIRKSFVKVLYLFLDASVHSFSKAKVEENCELRKTVFICIICDWTGLISLESDFKWHFANCVMNSQVTSQIAPFNYPM